MGAARRETERAVEEKSTFHEIAASRRQKHPAAEPETCRGTSCSAPLLAGRTSGGSGSSANRRALVLRLGPRNVYGDGRADSGSRCAARPGNRSVRRGAAGRQRSPAEFERPHETKVRTPVAGSVTPAR